MFSSSLPCGEATAWEGQLNNKLEIVVSWLHGAEPGHGCFPLWFIASLDSVASRSSVPLGLELKFHHVKDSLKGLKGKILLVSNTKHKFYILYISLDGAHTLLSNPAFGSLPVPSSSFSSNSSSFEQYATMMQCWQELEHSLPWHVKL